MPTVELKAIHQEENEALEFLRSKIKGKVKAKGTQVQIDGATTKEVKLLLHKFLHHKGLTQYKVLSQAGTLEVFPLQSHLAHKHQEEGTPPPAAYTVPYFFPNTPVPMPEKEKKFRPKRGERSRIR